MEMVQTSCVHVVLNEGRGCEDGRTDGRRKTEGFLRVRLDKAGQGCSKACIDKIIMETAVLLCRLNERGLREKTPSASETRMAVAGRKKVGGCSGVYSDEKGQESNELPGPF